jgi:hypothetical protein
MYKFLKTLHPAGNPGPSAMQADAMTTMTRRQGITYIRVFRNYYLGTHATMLFPTERRSLHSFVNNISQHFVALTNPTKKFRNIFRPRYSKCYLKLAFGIDAWFRLLRQKIAFFWIGQSNAAKRRVATIFKNNTWLGFDLTTRMSSPWWRAESIGTNFQNKKGR